MYITHQLAQSRLFQSRPEALPVEDRVLLTYERARAIGRAYAFTAEDVLTLSPKFWAFHTDPIVPMDGAAATLVTLQYNCCAGTLAMFAKKQPELETILQQVLDFDVSGQFCLTEVGHGLDVINMETTATLLPGGEFELHTPHENAAKYMPPTTPVGIPCVAIIFARAIIEGIDHGVKPFIVRLHDGKDMVRGIVTKLIPHRGGSRPLNHSLTYFNRVRIPFSALLGKPDKPDDTRLAFFQNISRVIVGTIAIGSFAIPMIQVSAYICAKYSIRRTVIDPNKRQTKSILSFRTQKTPVCIALAQAAVLKAFHEKAVEIFKDPKVDHRARHAIAAIFKVTTVLHGQSMTWSLGDRCGSQGLFEANQITAMNSDLRGSSIAEGDLLVISIRFASELLLGRYSVPPTTNPTSLLSRHENSLFEELREVLAGMSHHRSDSYDRLILPECLNLIQAIGHRMAYDAAVEATLTTDVAMDHNVTSDDVSARLDSINIKNDSLDPIIANQSTPQLLISLYLSHCISLDPAWYIEKAGMTRFSIREMENSAVDRVYERLDEILDAMEQKDCINEYVTAPLISEEGWKQYVISMTTFGASMEERDDELRSEAEEEESK